MKITVKKLRELNACNSGIEYFGSKHSDGVELTDLIREDIETNNWRIFEYANWLIAHCMTYEQRIDYIIYAAELGLPTYNKIYPNDSRIHDCIQAIKDFRDGKITKKQLLDAVADAHAAAHAAYAAAHAAYVAAYATDATDAAHAAAHAAYAAADAAYAAAYAAYATAHAAYATADAADAAAHYAADAAYAAAYKNAMMIKILKYGITLLEMKNENNS